MYLTTRNSTYSRWASEAEIRNSLHEAKLNGGKQRHGGIPLFASSGSAYVDPTDTHSLVIGSTGSKKTRLIGMPALLLYAGAGESFIATDPKAELYDRTLPLLRERGYRVVVLNLRDPLRSDGWNPLAVPHRLYHAGQRDRAGELVIDMASCIMKEDCGGDPYWPNSAADMLSGLTLLLFECGGKDEIHFKSLHNLRIQSFGNSKNASNHDTPFIQDHFLRHMKTASFARSLLSGTAEVCDHTRSCILSVFDQALQPFFSNDKLIDMLSGSDLDMSAIGKEKTAVFLIIPDENTLYHRLVSVFVKQCYTELILEAHRQPSKRLPRRVNFLLDEFSALPQISDFPAMITASRSRNIRFNLIVQSLRQLQARYGGHVDTIKGNCENWVFLHSRELELLHEIVELCGKRNSEENLVSVSMLQTLDKEKGEALVMHKRLHPFIACLPDIDRYPGIALNGIRAWYPRNTRKAKKVFDFERFCRGNSEFFISKLFSGKTLDEIRNTSREEQERYYLADDDATFEPVFTPGMEG